MEQDEISLISACQNGDMVSFGLLYDHYIRRIYDFIYYKTLHKETAEDLTSQTFMKALRQIRTFDTERGSFSAWLYRIARNTVIDHYRAVRPTQDIADVWDLSSSEDVQRDTEARMKLEDIQQYLAQLKPDQRDVVLMRVWNDMTYAEIAQALGKSEASCKMIFSRTMKELRQTMPLAAFLLLIAYRVIV